MATEKWILVLRSACKKETQAEVARKLNISTTTISHVLKGNYAGSMSNIKARVEGALMSLTVDCPAVGMEIGRNICMDNQRRSFCATNPQRVRLAQTCPTCAHKTGASEG